MRKEQESSVLLQEEKENLHRDNARLQTDRTHGSRKAERADSRKGQIQLLNKSEQWGDKTAKDFLDQPDQKIGIGHLLSNEVGSSKLS